MPGGNILPAFILLIVSVALYLPMLGADFVWDSRPQILTDTYIHHLGNLWDVLSLRVLHLDVLDFNRPVNLLTLMLDSVLWGRNPAGYHFTSILWHAATVVMLFLFCRNFVPRAQAACVALIFAVHPIQCEAVAEVGYREDVLAGFFVLAGLNFAAVFKPERSWKAAAIGFACAFCFFAAVSAKENGIVGPVALAAYWWMFRRKEPRKGWLLLIVASGLAVGGFLAARFLLEPKGSAIFISPPHRLRESFGETLVIQTRIWTFQMRQVVLPMNLCADYGAWSIRNFETGLCFVAFSAVIIAQVFISMRNRVFALGTAVFWCALLPVSNFIPIYRPLADRFLYLPMTGVALMLCSFDWQRCATSMAAWLKTDERPLHRVTGAVALLAASALSVATFQREKTWHDTLALWSDTAQKNPYSYDAALNLGEALFNAGKLTDSVASYERAIQMTNGKTAEAWAEAALPLDALGRTADADAAFKKAVELKGIYAHPDELAKGLTWDKRHLDRLQIIARRNGR